VERSIIIQNDDYLTVLLQLVLNLNGRRNGENYIWSEKRKAWNGLTLC